MSEETHALTTWLVLVFAIVMAALLIRDVVRDSWLSTGQRLEEALR